MVIHNAGPLSYVLQMGAIETEDGVKWGMLGGEYYGASGKTSVI